MSKLGVAEKADVLAPCAEKSRPGIHRAQLESIEPTPPLARVRPCIRALVGGELSDDRPAVDPDLLATDEAVAKGEDMEDTE
ncbi:MAG: hypothetical protein LC659_13400, partial [Myxococcales bacterium]|nr:hypothetical protein [Myxococcales bacterium]